MVRCERMGGDIYTSSFELTKDTVQSSGFSSRKWDGSHAHDQCPGYVWKNNIQSCPDISRYVLHIVDMPMSGHIWKYQICTEIKERHIYVEDMSEHVQPYLCHTFIVFLDLRSAKSHRTAIWVVYSARGLTLKTCSHALGGGTCEHQPQ